MVLEPTTTQLVRCTWESISIIRDVEKVDTFIKMELFTMEIGRMGTKEE